MYTKNLIAHKGTDNQILIEFVNQDQKRVDITDKEFTCRLISHDGTTLLLEKPLVMVQALQGQTKLVLTEEELDVIAPGTVGFSVEQTADSELYEPVYVADNAGARGLIEITDSIMPSFVPSEIITIPDHPETVDPRSGGVDTIYTSSIYDANDNAGLHTFQFVMHQYTGTITAEGSVNATGPWYTIQVETVAMTDLHTFNVEGFHPYIRFTMDEDIEHAVGAFKVGFDYRIEEPGTTDFLLLGADYNTRGTVFTATGTGDALETGTAIPLFDTITEVRHR